MTQKIVVFILFISSLNSYSQQDSNKIVRVLSFNIYHGATMKGDFDLDVIANVIKKSNPDLVALQEVDFNTKRAKKYNLALELGYKTNLNPLFGAAMPYDGGEYGEAILSKYSFIESKLFALPYSEGREPRAALGANIVLPSGDTISFIGTHLDHLKDDSDRIKQTEEINKILSEIKYPVILAGDLNAEPQSTPIKILEEFWTATYKSGQLEFTSPSGNPRKKIDYVLYYPRERWKVLSTEVINDPIASDHCAYLVSLQLMN